MLARGFLHTVLPLRVRPHLAEPELYPHATAMKGKNTNLQMGFERLLFIKIELNIRT